MSKSTAARLFRRTQRSIPSRARLVGIGVVSGLAAACGGGGGGGSEPASQPTVTSSSVGVVNYTQTVTVTLNGTNLDQPLNVSSPACATLTRGTAAPLASSSTTAYYVCGGATVGAGQITVQRASDGTTLRTENFTVGLPPQVTLTVDGGPGVQGDVVVTLAADGALTPNTVTNFLAYVAAKHYDGTVFHRVYSDFVVQGGGYEPPAALRSPTRAPIELEVNKGLLNKQWTIAMARASAPNSAQAQFYFNVIDNPHLDASATNDGYAVFGHVSAGADVVAAIAGKGCTIPGSNLGQSCWPNPNVLITSAKRTR